MPAQYREFFELPFEQQHEEMRRLPTDKQIDIYLVGMSYVHPPQVGLADDIAKKGREAIPFLVKRINEEKLDTRRADLMYVLQLMHHTHYDLRDERDVLQQLKSVAAEMKDPYEKARAEAILRDLGVDVK